MNKDEMNRAIHEAIGKPMFVMLKQGAYYRTGASGYTVELSEAGQWPEDEARRLECSKGFPDEVKAVPAPIPDYTTCLNACHEMEKHLNPGLLKFPGTPEAESDPWNRYVRELVGVCQKTLSSCYHASPEQRAEAFLRTLNLYQDTRES